MSAYDLIRQAVRARLSEIRKSGRWHTEDIEFELEFLLEEIDRIEAEHAH